MPSLHEQIEENANTDLDDIKEVPPLPIGNYLCQVLGQYEETTSTRKQTPAVQFTLRLLSAGDDVDQPALQAYLEATRSRLSDVTIKHMIWDSPYAMTTLKHFLRDTLGLAGPLKESLARAPGQQLIATVIHRSVTADDGTTRLLAQVGSTARAL